jgi:hypothetical protein
LVSQDELRVQLNAAVGGGGAGISTADQLCHACVQLLDVDGAAISLTYEGASRGTFGSSGELSRRLDEFQFTFGEGPCLDAVSSQRAVLVPDLRDPDEHRWPGYAEAVLRAGVQSVFALPVRLATNCVGALDLFHNAARPLSERALAGGLIAAELAALPLLDLMSSGLDWANAAEGGDGWDQLASLERVEVYQATGMIMGQLDVGPVEALLRLRAHAFSHDMTASTVAWSIVDRRLRLDVDHPGPGAPTGHPYEP